MIDRVSLLVALAHLKPKITPMTSGAFHVKLNEAIGLLVTEFTLEEARIAHRTVGEPFDVMFDLVLTESLVRTVSGKWDPDRVVPKGVSHTQLATELRQLVHGDRDPFDPTPLSLVEFRAMTREAREGWLLDLRRFGDKKQVGAVLKKWDAKLSPVPTDLAEVHAHLGRLGFQQVEPSTGPFKVDTLAKTRSWAAPARVAWFETLATRGADEQRAVLSKWDPHIAERPDDVLNHLRRLASGDAQPAKKQKPAPPVHQKAARKGVRS